MTPKERGNRTEGAVMAALIKAGKTVLLPIGENLRYDLVIDEGGRFVRVQCKTAHFAKNGDVLVFKAHSSHSHRGKGIRNYVGSADVFGVYSPDLDKIFLVPVSAVGENGIYLRTGKAKNNQCTGIRMASEFEFPGPSLGA
jgi:hypothetical protein